MKKKEAFVNKHLQAPYTLDFLNCMLQKDKQYKVTELVEDLGQFFTYLPTSEISRFVNSLVWCLQEGIKNRGTVSIQNLGSWKVTDREPSYKGLIGTDVGVFTPKLQNHKRRVTLCFTPSVELKSLITPRTIDYFTGLESYFFVHQLSATNHPFFVARHYRRGAALLQRAFTKDLAYVGYTDKYLKAAEEGLVPPVGEELKEIRENTCKNLHVPDYVKRGFTDELMPTKSWKKDRQDFFQRTKTRKA